MAKNEPWQEGDGDAWKTKKPRMRKKRLNRQVAEERRDTAVSERWRRAHKSLMKAREVLDLFEYHYSFGMVGWEKRNDDGPFLVILLLGKVIIRGEVNFIPADILEATRLEIEKFYAAEGVKTSFLSESGTLLLYKEDIESERALGKPSFNVICNKPIQKRQHGRRNR
ncbi:MAG: hypothetical protein AAB787_01245 [Patescibacteria group bacterium]